MKPRIHATIASFIVFFGGLVTYSQVATNSKDKAKRASVDSDNELRLVPTVLNEQYCSDVGTRFLTWRLKLTYTNIGTRPLLLEKKSTYVYRKVVSRDFKAAAAERYVSAPPIGAYADLDFLGLRDTPDLAAFVVLKPTESFTVEADTRVSVYDGTKDTEDDLHPGQYVVQLRVSTWYHYADPKQYREKWSDRGCLWSDNVTSEPMAFTVQKHPKLVPCTE